VIHVLLPSCALPWSVCECLLAYLHHNLLCFALLLLLLLLLLTT
jgi:hypothetical protein